MIQRTPRAADRGPRGPASSRAAGAARRWCDSPWKRARRARRRRPARLAALNRQHPRRAHTNTNIDLDLGTPDGHAQPDMLGRAGHRPVPGPVEASSREAWRSEGSPTRVRWPGPRRVGESGTWADGSTTDRVLTTGASSLARLGIGEGGTVLKPGYEFLVTFLAAADGPSPVGFLKTITGADGTSSRSLAVAPMTRQEGGPPWIFVEG